MSTPEALRKARKDYRDRQKAAGSKLSAFMLSSEALAALDKLAVKGVSKAQAVNAALISAAAAREMVPVQVLDVDAEHRLPEPPKPTGSKKDGARTKKAEKPRADWNLDTERGSKATRAALGLDLPVGPQPFTPRLKGEKKGKAK